MIYDDMIRYVICYDVLWYMVYDIWYMVYDIWFMIRNDIKWYDIWYDICYDIWYDIR